LEGGWIVFFINSWRLSYVNSREFSKTYRDILKDKNIISIQIMIFQRLLIVEPISDWPVFISNNYILDLKFEPKKKFTFKLYISPIFFNINFSNRLSDNDQVSQKVYYD